MLFRRMHGQISQNQNRKDKSLDQADDNLQKHKRDRQADCQNGRHGG